MAYNLQTLITILEKILDPEQTRWIVDHNKPQVKSLLEKAISLQQILEKSSLPKIKISLENQIRDASHKAEDIIESRMVDQILCTSLMGWLISWCKCFTFSSPDLQQVIKELDSAMKQVVKLVEVEGKNTTSSSSSSTTRASISSLVVGVDEDLMQLKERLTGMQSKLEIIPIVGMGGVGKTTLARNLYQDPSIISHFAAHAWTTMSQNFNMQAVLLELVRCINGKEHDKHSAEWGNLYRSLYGKRYMIVLDDIWSAAWDGIWMYFPDNNNGSRIVLTTRESDVAKHASLRSWQHQVQLLSESMSWNLLRQIVFGEEEENCPYVLQEIGRKIASGCNGLPLAINVIGGVLSNLQRSKHVWENIGNDVTAAIAESDDQFSNILSLSYNHLPNHLKPCFLYMGAFPKYYKVKRSALVSMWLGEGFLKSNGNSKSLEEEAEDCLKALVERNLLMIRRNKPNGKPSSYIIHDLLRDLCIRKVDEEKFLHIFKYSPELTLPKLRRARASRLCGMEAMYASTELMSLARTFLCTDIVMQDIITSVISASRLLRVLDIKKEKFKRFPREILQLVNLRYLTFSCDESLPTGISRLLNLQTLIAELRWCYGPSEIWDMSELRHAKFNRAYLTHHDKETNFVVKKKMQTISHVGLTRSLMSRGFLQSIPNIKKLGIYFDDSAVVDLSHLHKLETLICRSGTSNAACFFLRNLIFPLGVRKLTLVGGVIFPEALCALPDLEFLNMMGCKFARNAKDADEEWEAEEGDEFRSLQFLCLEKLDLVRWRTDETNFPKLRGLTVWKCPKLEEIPSAIGKITTLESISIGGFTDSVVESAKQIRDEQAENGNYGLQLRIIL